MVYYDDYKVLHHETDTGEWQTLILRLYSPVGAEGYDIPNEEVIPFLESHHIFIATLYPGQSKYIPAIEGNIERLDNLIDRQKVLFGIAVNDNFYENKTEAKE